jgi:hypothetical protein
MYNKSHGTSVMSHHVDSKHFAILRLYQKQCSNATTKFDVHQIAKKRMKPIVASIVDFFNSGVPWKKKQTLFKNNYLRIWYSTSQRAIVH